MDFYADIHHLDTAAVPPEGIAGDYESARVRFQRSVSFLDDLPLTEINSILDVGLGYGFHCEWFAERGKEVMGVSTHVAEDLRALANRAGFDVRSMDMHLLDVPDASVDLVWSSHSLEHSFSPLWALWEWRRVLSPQGWLAVTVPFHKTEVVSGHFNVGWSVGQLAYVLACVGYDVEEGRFMRERYEVRALVRRGPDRPARGLSWMHQLHDRFPPAIRKLMAAKPNGLGGYTFHGSLKSVQGDRVVLDKDGIGRSLANYLRSTIRSAWRKLRKRSR